MKEKAKDPGKEKTVVLNTRDLVLLFVFFVVVLMIVFTIGLLVGKNFTGEPQLTERRTPAADEGSARQVGHGRKFCRSRKSPCRRPRRARPPPACPRPPRPSSRPRRPPSSRRPRRLRRPQPRRPKTAAPMPAPAPAEPAPAAGTSVTYIVQALATRDLAEARALVDKLKAKGYDAFVKVAQPGASDQFNRVQVGRFKDMEHARELVARLKKDGFDAFPRKVLE